MSTSDPVVIIGAGHGGAALAAFLRQGGFAGQVMMVGVEEHLPYHRPPLSKKFTEADHVQLLRPPEFYSDNDIQLCVGMEATAVDRAAMRVELADGTTLGYSALVIATGSTPRRLSDFDANSPGVVTLRTLDDAAALGDAVRARRRLAIVGGGYVGMEVAAVARSHDVPVTIIEREERILARVASPQLSSRLSAHHERRGTDVRVGAQVVDIATRDGRPEAIELADGSSVDADVVLVGIGATPNDSLAVDAGLRCDAGIIVDAAGRTSDAHVYAVGDVTRRPVDGVAGLTRLESIPNATEQARQVAAAITGAAIPAAEVPWFWSDQFDLKLKIAGLVATEDQVVIREGTKPDSFAVFHLNSDDTIRAAETVNSPGEFMAAKKFIGQRLRVKAELLGDGSVAMRDVVLG
ncbi:FAD-dependent oxidoreductase [Gordonia sp. TBRC 11910]|uniref:FAD-dependent oxidoreductase n=1 Tax=Gordonia asplenii TaxID=2725283 RepID=A0A848L0I6_9ACTN|nr:FAD-dependent oxidoreductase [Gordonia asplenii]NMO03957.1 FAD-dependent oxidoreductase [Gordonia asplenii]